MSHHYTSHFPISRLLITCAAAVGVLGCHSSTSPTPAAESSVRASSTETPSTVQTFGAPLAASPEVELSALLAAPEQYTGKRVRVEGLVRKACNAKGCWMQLATSLDPSAPACRVTFKDYGFFVPTDSAGASAKVEAEVKLKRVGPAQVQHYEKEGALFPSKHEDGSADEVRLVATGVELRR